MIDKPLAANLAADLTLGHDQAVQLETVLNQEFGALSASDLQVFEALQPRKEELISALTALISRVDSGSGEWLARAGPSTIPFTESVEWTRLREVLDRCRDAHRRNDILIRTRLDAIRAALAVLQNGEGGSASELYDRRGRISPAFGPGGYADA